jgi:very-short-patch-repair endonuclease
MSFIPYNKNLKERARVLRNQGILSEVILWKHIKGDAFNVRFLRQKTILNYIVDFYCPKLKLVIEIDGSSHDFDPQSQYDADRQKQIEQLGIRFLRFSDYQVKHDIVNVLRQIECVVHELSNF